MEPGCGPETASAFHSVPRCAVMRPQMHNVPAVVFGRHGHGGQSAARRMGRADGAAGPGSVVHKAECHGLILGRSVRSIRFQGVGCKGADGRSWGAWGALRGMPTRSRTLLARTKWLVRRIRPMWHPARLKGPMFRNLHIAWTRCLRFLSSPMQAACVAGRPHCAEVAAGD